MSVIPALSLEAEAGGLPEVHFLEIHCEFQARPAKGRIRHLLWKNGRKEEREAKKGMGQGRREGSNITCIKALTSAVQGR